jgi:hypothetical protein
MRPVIDLDEKYKYFFYDLVKKAKATIVKVAPEFWTGNPEHARAGIEKSPEQVRDDQIKFCEEVKQILADRFIKLNFPKNIFFLLDSGK